MTRYVSNENEQQAGVLSISFKRGLSVCLVLMMLLLVCGGAGANNSPRTNVSNSSTISSVSTAASIPSAFSSPIPVITAQPVPEPTVDQVLEKQFVDRNIMRMRNITAADRKAAAANAAAKGLRVGGASNSDSGISSASNLTPYPGGTPDYWGPYPNYANSQLPTIDANGSVVAGTGIRKFVDSLPGLGATNANNLGKYLPVAVADTVAYPGADYYEIAAVQYVEKMHSDLPPTTLRGYVQLNTPNIVGSKNIPLFYPNGSQIRDANGTPILAYDNPHYLGPIVVAQKDKPVRVKFHNYLPTGTDGNLFIPVDTTLMGAGLGPLGTNTSGLPLEYSQNRAAVHLHGGNTPWISDGTPHQWTVPYGENTAYPEGVSVHNVPDMDNGNEPVGTMTFYYTNQQSARLMFYHDHALGITRLNVYAGEAAGYIVQDPQETALVASGSIPTTQIPLIFQDRTFVPGATQMAAEDPTWNWGGNKSRSWPNTGDLWFPHVYMTNQNPYDISGANAMGRWDYGPWFWPPFTGLLNGPVTNPFASPNAPWEGVQIPGTPNPSTVPEGFMDTPLVNGQVYPYVQLGPHAYRFRILNACNDRYLNLQLYLAGSNATMWNGTTLLNGSAGEVPMVPAVPNSGLPANWPTDGRDGGVPNPNATGPSWIQIGTEGGFLPAPVIVPSQPVSYDYNRRTITVLDVLNTSLYLGPAERADVIVDFTGIPDGTKLILYNDAPVPNPAFDSRYDYYTNDPDQVLEGGAPTTYAGYGPNTRTIMQIQINSAIGQVGPAFSLANLNAQLPGAFKASQAPPIVPQAAYNAAFGTTSFPADPYIRIQDSQTTFQPVNHTTPAILDPAVTMNLQPKSIIEDFDLEYGRMNAMLGVEVPRTTLQTQTSIPYFYIDPPTEVFNNSINGTQIGTLSDGTQIWKITHNGVDTHAIHWHMFNVQLINRVGWDGQVKPPYAYELGWKDTVKMRPLEDVIVAMRPITPDLPATWGQLPNSIRPLDPTSPLGTATSVQFHNIDPTNEPATVVNHLVNYGWEYVWHCHLLGHEEFDMMRAMAVAVAPVGTPTNLAAGKVVNTTTNLTSVFLSWTDNSRTETDWSIQRFNATNNSWNDMARVPSFTGPQNGSTAMAIVSIDNTTPDNLWRVLATNVVGDKTVYATPASGYTTVAVNSTPSTNVTPSIGNTPPTGLSFSAIPTTGNASLTVTFTGTATNAAGWSWDFGDGDATNGTGIQNPIHTYLTNGLYNVTFTAMNIGGNTSSTQTSLISVGTNVPRVVPVANFIATPLNGNVPLTVNFIDRSVNATNWNWTFGDNWSYGNTSTSISNLQNPTHTYIQPGNYTVSLNASNSAGFSNQVKIGYINVTNSPDRIGVYQNGVWNLDYNGNGTYDGPVTDKLYFLGGNGTTGNTTVYGDWNGDGRSKIGVYNNGTWYLDYNGDGVFTPGIDKKYMFGAAGWNPVVGDWNGDGRAEIGINNGPGWYLDKAGNGTALSATFYYFGASGWIPEVGDWTGNGVTKIGIYHDGAWYLDRAGNGTALSAAFYYFGAPGWNPVIGDWNGDGKTEIGINNGPGWYLDKAGNGSASSATFYYYGASGWAPVVGDWNGDGTSKIGIYFNGFWYLDKVGNGSAATATLYHFGTVGWLPVSGKWS